MEPRQNKGDIEDRIRAEFSRALADLENASIENKPQATSRLNRAVRRLFDFVGYGKTPTDWRRPSERC
jgi:hypothetical protein